MEDGKLVDSQYEAKFRTSAPLYERLVEEVKYVLQARLDASGIRTSSLTGRVKSAESLKAKVARKGYAHPLDETADLAGVRAVCHYEGDTARIAETIRNNFNVLEYVDRSLDLGVDKMGYGGIHFVVTLGSRYLGGRYDGIAGLKCEVQVRTVLQDAWAMISHELAYKSEATVPRRLQRDLNSVSTLLEIAQRTFDLVRQERETYVREIQEKEQNPSMFLSQPLDYETLLAYSRWKFPSLPTSDKLNLILLQDLDQQTYPTLAQLDEVVERAKHAVEAYRRENPDWFKSGTDFITKSLGFVDKQFRAKHGFAKRTREAIARHRDLVKEDA